jgi:hypothetical protein
VDAVGQLAVRFSSGRVSLSLDMSLIIMQAGVQCYVLEWYVGSVLDLHPIALQQGGARCVLARLSSGSRHRSCGPALAGHSDWDVDGLKIQICSFMFRYMLCSLSCLIVISLCIVLGLCCAVVFVI